MNLGQFRTQTENIDGELELCFEFDETFYLLEKIYCEDDRLILYASIFGFTKEELCDESLKEYQKLTSFNAKDIRLGDLRKRFRDQGDATILYIEMGCDIFQEINTLRIEEEKVILSCSIYTPADDAQGEWEDHEEVMNKIIPF